MSKLAILAVPYILTETHYTFMVHTVLSLLSCKHDHHLDLIAVVNAFDRPEADLEWLRRSFDHVEMNDRNCLARAWNKGIARALDRGADYILLINLDLMFHSQFIAELLQFAGQHPEHLVWGGDEWKDRTTLESAALEEHNAGVVGVHFNCFLIDRRLFDQIGEFDEQFEPAYHEDSDMIYRVKLAGKTMFRTSRARYHHFDRITIKGAAAERQEEFLDKLRLMMDNSMALYEKKWGGLPSHERFNTPYNQASD